MNQPALASATSGEVAIHQPDRTLSFLDAAVQTFEGIERIAGLMAKMGTMPIHLQGKPADCFRIVIQAAKWRMDPFAVAECTSLVHGRLCMEGKLIAAALRSTGAIEGRLDYEISGSGAGASIVVTGTPKGGKLCSVRGTVADWRTVTKKDGNVIPNAWDKQPETMLVYRGTRQWARMYAPEAILGVTTQDEAEEIREVVGTVVPDPKPAVARDIQSEAVATETKQPESTPTPAAPDFSVEACHAALSDLYKSGDSGKAKAKAILASWKLTMVQDLKGGTEHDRETFLKDVSAAKAKVAEGVKP